MFFVRRINCKIQRMPVVVMVLPDPIREVGAWRNFVETTAYRIDIRSCSNII